jgi:hypothetical protein
MMRITITVGVTVLVGAVFGFGLAMWMFYRLPEQTSLVDGITGPADPSRPRAQVEVDEAVHDFGSMDSRAKGTHDFVFRNVGNGPLELQKGRTTCKCTLSDIGDGLIPPGGSGIVTLEWSGKAFVGPYEQTAKIITNDPDRPVVDLEIRGEMTAKARAVPGDLVFSSVTAGQTASADVQVFGYVEKRLEVTGYESDDPDHLEVSFSPMADEKVKEEEYATCGQLMSVTLKPGLPLGPFRGKIRVMTNIEGFEEIVVPVRATITSEISVLGADWHAESAILQVGAIESTEPVRKKLFLKVGGLDPAQVQFEVGEVYPGFVKVRIGERTSSPGRPVAVTPIEIEFPEGSPPGNHLGPKNLGRIRLKTTHAEVKELDINLRFLIRG